MSALLAHATAFRLLSQAYEEIGVENPTWQPAMMVEAAVYRRAADKLEAAAKLECSGEPGSSYTPPPPPTKGRK